MPDPGPSPLQSSLPAAAARFGAHGHGRGVEAVGISPPALPAGPPVLPTGPRVRAADPMAGVPTVSAGPAVSEVPERAPNPALGRILRGPSGLGTAALHLARREEPPARPEPSTAGRPIPGLYHHPVPEPDPVRVEEVSNRIKTWAVDEVELYPRSGKTSSTASPWAATWSPAIRTPPPSTT